MADTLVERATGRATAAAVPVEVQVVISDRALFTNVVDADPNGSGETPAQIPGYGTVPAAWARELVRDSPAQAWLRRLYTHPDDGTLVAMDSHRRTFTGGLRRFLIARDGTCTTPWCDAPIAHLDHVVPHADGGPTTADNGRGTCVRSNLTKEHPGWQARPAPGPSPRRWRAHTVTITTPTGHQYASTAPPVLPGGPLRDESVLERHLETLLAA